METYTFLPAFIGGLLIGAAVCILLWFSGKVAGNSGIAAGVFSLKRDQAWWRLYYLAGLIIGSVIFNWCTADETAIVINASYPVLILAGFFVGYGTRMGGGCTSGHGICGIARLSKRSVIATLTFMATAIITVYLVNNFPGGGI